MGRSIKQTSSLDPQSAAEAFQLFHGFLASRYKMRPKVHVVAFRSSYPKSKRSVVDTIKATINHLARSTALQTQVASSFLAAQENQNGKKRSAPPARRWAHHFSSPLPCVSFDLGPSLRARILSCLGELEDDEDGMFLGKFSKSLEILRCHDSSFLAECLGSLDLLLLSREVRGHIVRVQSPHHSTWSSGLPQPTIMACLQWEGNQHVHGK